MGRGHPLRGLVTALTLGTVLVWPICGGAEVPTPDRATGSNQGSARPFRVCADPDDLPFSSVKPGISGIYVELGQRIAQTLNRPFEPVWTVSYFGKRTVRTTLLANTCDAYVGLPGKGFMGPQLIFSKPFMRVGYAIMAPAGEHITRLSDLSGKRVGVQFSTPPQLVLANREDVHGVTFLTPDEAALAVGRHDVDAAFIWGPTAGYINTTVLHGAYQVTPVAGEGMQYPVTIGYRKVDAGLRDQVDRLLDDNPSPIAGLVEKYGMPTASPVDLASREDASAAVIVLASTGDSVPGPAETVQAAASPTAADIQTPASPEMVAEGQKIFNGTCSHCHGPDAVQAVKKIDLRLLHHRYGDQMETVYHDTVTHGRPAKGMPNWSKVFSEEDFTKILAFLSTKQTD